MSVYAGLDQVDPNALEAQYALTEALWTKLLEQGVEDGTPGRIEAFFFAEHEIAAAALAAAFVSKGDWRRELVALADDSAQVRVKLITPMVALTRQAFLELVDVAMVAAHARGCVFDGFQVDVSALQRRPWWRFW